MNRLIVRLVVTHVLVAVVAVIATYLVVRQLAPMLFDESLRMSSMGQGPFGMGGQAGMLRDQVARAVDQAVLVGALTGAAAATLVGAAVAYALVRPLERVRAATRAMAKGRYAATVAAPHQRELAELAEDINLLGHTLAETESRRVRLLGEVAHEMRTPLTVIDGYVEGMIDGVLPTTPDALGQVSDEVRRLRRLADDLSALSRTEEAPLGLRRERLDLRGLVERAAERLRPQAVDAGLSLVVDAGTEPLTCDVDPDRVAQVVTNLLGNAVRAGAPGGSVHLTCRRDGNQARLEVLDTGEGIAQADLERIFERFYRAPGRRGSGDGGSGIGLTIARGIVRAHGGDIVAASPGRGHGATFTVHLPLVG